MPTMLDYNICKVLDLNYAKYAKLCFLIKIANFGAKLCQVCLYMPHFHKNSQILELKYAKYARYANSANYAIRIQ